MIRRSFFDSITTISEIECVSKFHTEKQNDWTFSSQFDHSVQKGGGEYNGICEENFHLLLEKKIGFQSAAFHMSCIKVELAVAAVSNCYIPTCEAILKTIQQLLSSF